MRLGVLLVILLITLLPFNITGQSTAGGYMGLKQLEVKTTDTNNLLFFCRRSNDNDFLNDSLLPWQESILLTSTNDTFKIKARFNDSQKENIEVLIAGTPHILFPEKVRAILIGEKIYIVSKYPEKDQLFLSYFELICEGKTSLLLKDSKIYYYKNIDQPAFKLTRSKKVIGHIFKKDKKALDKFILNNKVNPKKDKDIIRIFNFMNTTQN